MALSNWDTLAVNLDGKPISGDFKSPLGVKVSFYKNWLYVYDEIAWREKSGWSKPCVMQINHGDIIYLDVEIKAVRGPQNGIFAVVTSGYGDTLTGMIGCGVSGYDEEKWVGVTEESKSFLQQFISGSYSRDREQIIDELKHQKIYTLDPEDGESVTNYYDDAVERGSLERIIQIHSEPSYHFDDRVRKVNLGSALRFNQGDAFFATAFKEDIPATKVGESDIPFLEQAFKPEEK